MAVGIHETWTRKCGCPVTLDIVGPQRTYAFYVQFESVQKARWFYETSSCDTCDKKALDEYNANAGYWDSFSDEEKHYLNKAYEKARQINRPFTAQEVAQEAWNAGLDLDIAHDPRFRHYNNTVGFDRLHVLAEWPEYQDKWSTLF